MRENSSADKENQGEQEGEEEDQSDVPRMVGDDKSPDTVCPKSPVNASSRDSEGIHDTKDNEDDPVLESAPPYKTDSQWISGGEETGEANDQE